MSRSRDRWPARPLLGAVVRAIAIVAPVVAGLAVALLLVSILPAADGWPGRIGWWIAVLGGSTVAMLIVDRAARRLLPLAVLLDLALVFPGPAPSRLRSSRSTSVRELEKRLLALRSQGATGRPIDAAETLVTLVGILGLHDRRTRGHSERVRAFTDLLTDELGLNDDARVRIRWAALVHDIGKLSVPGAVLNGGRDLDADSWTALREHPHEGRRLAAGLMPWLGEWGSAVEQHHERWDGTGYPHGIAGEDIGYGARIVAVADAFDTMTSVRSYNKPRTAHAAREELTRCAGTQFDPAVVRAFLAVSVPRLSWVLGPVTWLAQLPFVVAADRAGRAVKAGATATAVSGLVVVGVLHGPGVQPSPSPSPVPAVAAAGVTSPPTGSGTGTTPAGGELPAALPFTADGMPTVVAERPAASPASPVPVPAPAPSPAPVPRVPPVTRPVVIPSVAPSPVVPTPPVATSPPAVPTVASPTPSPSTSPVKAKPGKRKGNGKGNGHFGQNNAGHARHGAG